MESVKVELQNFFHEFDQVQDLFFKRSDKKGKFRLNACDTHGKTLLHYACEHGIIKAVKCLLINGAEGDICDKKGYTPLYYACRKKIHIKICQMLTKYTLDPISTLQETGIDGSSAVTVKDDQCKTVLHHACYVGSLVLVRRLLEAGADPVALDVHGNSPLHYASMKGRLDIVRFFLIHKASISGHDINGLLKVPNSEGETPLTIKSREKKENILHKACKMGDPFLVRKLLEAGADPNVADGSGFTPLMRVVSHSKMSDTEAPHDMITALCNKNCNVNYSSLVPCKFFDSSVESTLGLTALHIAVRRNCPISTVKTLIDNGAVLNVTDGHGRTPLHIASIQGHHSMMKLLAPTPRYFRIRDKSGCTPLYYACKNSHLECIREIISETAKFHVISNLANNDGTTPLSVMTQRGRSILHVACEKGDIFVVKKLLEAGADPNITDKYGFTPLMRTGMSVGRVSDTNASSIITALCKTHNCNLNAKYVAYNAELTYQEGSTALHMATDVDNIESDSLSVKALVENGAKLDARDIRGRTPLHIASIRGHHSLITLLAPTQESFHVQDRLGYTPLYYACKNSNLSCIRKIFSYIDAKSIICNFANAHGVNALSVMTKDGGTILHVACARGDVFVAKKLLEAGADPNIKDKNGVVPLVLALRNADPVKASTLISILCEFECNIKTVPFALHYACERNMGQSVEVLVSRGADIHVKDRNGCTPLHIVCKLGYHSLMSLLITKQTLEDFDHSGCLPLDYACKYHHIECVKKLISIGGLESLLLVHYVDGTCTIPISRRDTHHRTILHHACLAIDVQFTKDLIVYADSNVQDHEGQTPLMLALQYHSHNDILLDLVSILVSSNWKTDIQDKKGRTALHYSAKCDDVKIPLMLLSAGCDITAIDNNGQTFSDLISAKSQQLLNQQLLKIDRRQIICVIGYPKCGKTTLIAAFIQCHVQQTQNRFKRLTASGLVLSVSKDNRTAGIDTKVMTSGKFGSLIYFDFAGQAEYYASHLAFLESALASKGSAITFIMMIDLKCSEDKRFKQCVEWLFPIKSILNKHNKMDVILIGSHLDQVRSEPECVQSLGNTFMKLKSTLDTPQMRFIDCWGMDCRRLSSKGMTKLQNYLESTHSSRNVSSSHVPLGACLLFDRLKKSENPPLAITPHEIINKLKDGRAPFPLTVKYIDSCCQDLAASGLVLYIPNKENAEDSWLILEMEEILSHIHGKVFAPDSAEFPIHHKNLANRFGLVHIEELVIAFKDNPLAPEMVEKFLMVMEFCHPVDSSLMNEETMSIFLHSKVITDKQYSETTEEPFLNTLDTWLFFPSLVKVNEESIVLSTESDIPGDDCHWVCWELSTVKPHFLHPRFQQAVFIRLVCNHVQKHKSDLCTVEEHSCTISKNAMSWSTIHGVDVCVQIMHKSTIKVLARSRPGVKVSSLMEMFSSVVSDVLTVRANHAPGVDAYSVFRVMEKGKPDEHTVPVSSIIDVVQAGGMFVNSRECPPKLVSLNDLFLNWELSVPLLEKMVVLSTETQVLASKDRHVSVTSVSDTNQSESLDVADLYSSLCTEDMKGSTWKLMALNLGIDTTLVELIEKACADAPGSKDTIKDQTYKECLYNVLEAWLLEEIDTGDLPRTWNTVVTALESSNLLMLADSLKKQIGNPKTPHNIGTPHNSGEDLEKNTIFHEPSQGQNNHTYKDMRPSDIGLLGILDMLPVWEEYTIPLGLSIDRVKYYESLPQQSMRGLEALQYWRDGRCGSSYPGTWNFLFHVIDAYVGSNVAANMRKKVATNKAWTYTSQRDTLPSLVDEVHDSKGCTKPVVRTQEEASESDVPHEDEESTHKLQLHQSLLQRKPNEEKLVQLVGSQMCAQWNTFSLYLGVEEHIRDEISLNCHRVAKDCFIEVVGRWLSHEDGTGDNPRTWETVFSALRDIGRILLVKEVIQKLSKGQNCSMIE